MKDLVHSVVDVINEGIRKEEEAVRYYSFILRFIHNGNHRRSIVHILNDEREHLRTLKRIKKEMGLK